jgi:hypothetical protein
VLNAVPAVGCFTKLAEEGIVNFFLSPLIANPLIFFNLLKSNPLIFKISHSTNR